MGAEEDVAGELAEGGEGVLEVGGDAGVGLGVAGCGDELVVVERGEAADDDDVAELRGGLAGDVDFHGPCGAAAGVAGGLVGGQGDVAEGDGVAIVEDAVDAGGGEGSGDVVAEGEVGVTAGANGVGVVLHDEVLGVGFAEDLGEAANVVGVGLAIEDDLDVGVAEAELLDAGADERR